MSKFMVVLRDQGYYNQCDALNRQALHLREKPLGRECPATLIGMNKL